MKQLTVIVAALALLLVPASASAGEKRDAKVLTHVLKKGQKLINKVQAGKISQDRAARKAKRLLKRAERHGYNPNAYAGRHGLRHGGPGDVGAFIGGVIGGVAAVTQPPVVYAPAPVYYPQPVYRPWWRPWGGYDGGGWHHGPRPGWGEGGWRGGEGRGGFHHGARRR